MGSSDRSSDITATALLYHNVGPHRSGTYRSLVVSPSVFERQISTLAARGYTGISAKRWLEGLRGRDLPSKPVVLTFDDGFSDFIQHGAPVLERYGFGATIFVVTDLLGDEDEWLRREGQAPQKLLSADQVRSLADRGFDIGAHSRTHADLTGLSPHDLEAELRGSRDTLESLLQSSIESFAYPYGYHNATVVQVARKYFAVAFTVEEGRNSFDTDPLQLRRTMVQPGDGRVRILMRAALGFDPLNATHHRLAAAKNRMLGRQQKREYAPVP